MMAGNVLVYGVTTRERGSEHYPIKMGFTSDAKARAWAKKELGSLRGYRIIQGYVNAEDDKGNPEVD